MITTVSLLNIHHHHAELGFCFFFLPCDENFQEPEGFKEMGGRMTLRIRKITCVTGRSQVLRLGDQMESYFCDCDPGGKSLRTKLKQW